LIIAAEDAALGPHPINTFAGGKMAEVTLYKPDATVRYPNASDASVQNGVLSFSLQKDSIHPFEQKIQTNVPFLVVEDLGS
jgi:hypothetical protein